MRQSSGHPDLILFNGVLRTQDAHRPLASAVAVAGNRILHVGDDAEILDLAGPKTLKEDLDGATVAPGFHDAHFHVYEWALNRQNLALADMGSLDELLGVVQATARRTEPGQWICGQGWNEADWPVRRMPLRADLDRAAPNHPVFLLRCDLHLAAVNSAALKQAGIDHHTPDPPEGKIERDANGAPTGVLRELAINLVREAIPEPSDAQIEAALRDSLAELHSYGITGVHDIRLMQDKAGAAALQGWQRLHESGDLNLRCWVTLPGESLDQAIALGLRTGLGDDRLRIGHLKYFADGGMGARTAWLTEPYLDADLGMPLTDPEELERAIRKADQKGLAVMAHAVGDRANRELVGIFERLAAWRRTQNGQAPRIRHRIEHLQMIRPEDLARLSQLDLCLCAQPHNMILDMNLIDAALGPLGKHTYAFRQLIDTGLPVMLSSDSPVCDPRPLVGISAAVSRQRLDGSPEGGWHPQNRISVDEALRCYTWEPARAHGQDHLLGAISPGKYADMVVLDRDIHAVDPLEIADIQVRMTLFDGVVVYRR